MKWIALCPWADKQPYEFVALVPFPSVGNLFIRKEINCPHNFLFSVVQSLSFVSGQTVFLNEADL